MGANTEISWTDSTFNPWWGCQRVSPGCEHCYAETFAHRLGLDVWGPKAARRTFGAKHWDEPLNWNRAAEKAGKRHRVFCSSMADVFEIRTGGRGGSVDWDLDGEREKLWKLIEITPWLDWQLLTKRPENMRQLAPSAWASGWPPNVWAGCTVESQEYAVKRIDWLVGVPARVRFLSCEPLLGPVDLEPWLKGLQWVIVGGESGPKARPFNLEWAYALRDQCAAARCAFFFKQAGENAWDGDHRLTLSKKGGALSELPSGCHVRQMPEASQ